MKASQMMMLALCATLVIFGSAHPATRHLAGSENSRNYKSCPAVINLVCKTDPDYCYFLLNEFLGVFKTPGEFCKAWVEYGGEWNCAKICQNDYSGISQGECVSKYCAV